MLSCAHDASNVHEAPAEAKHFTQANLATGLDKCDMEKHGAKLERRTTLVFLRVKEAAVPGNHPHPQPLDKDLQTGKLCNSS